MVYMNEHDYPAASGRPRDGRPLPPEQTPMERYDDTAVEPAPVTETAPETAPPRETKPAKRGGAASSTWVALIIGALLLILLLVFILQNQQSVELHLFAWTWNFPLGVGLLLASIIGGLIMACAGIWKMFEMRRQLKNR
ncbi:hypothetical protein CHAN_05625 [Corynebacterium hansenii]|nr:hypothetical protein CHAN_05625 [Corynebacterium hansenii]